MEKSKLSVSIAMATFNGAQHLEDQFESLFAQTRSPDEVIVIDDASEDGTVILLDQIKSRAPFNVKIIAAHKNRGVLKAFHIATSHCSGDIVFFCDQDDVWEPRKIERVAAVFEGATDVGLVFSNASQIDVSGSLLPQSLWAVIGFDDRRLSSFRRCPMGEMLKGGNFIYGMASAFRASAIKDLPPISNTAAKITHDTWFAYHVLGTGWRGVALDELLVRYRRHENQVTKMASKDVKSEARATRWQSRNRAILDEIISLEKVERSISSCSTENTSSEVDASCRLLSHKIRFLKNRLAIRYSQKIMDLFRQKAFYGYYRYASGFRSIFRDIVGY